MTRLNLAIWQAAPDVSEPAGFCNKLDAAMSSTTAELFITPELFWPGYGDPVRARAGAVARDSAMIAAIRDLAARHRKALVFGYAETEGGVLFNSALCIGPDGKILQNYRKQTSANDYERGCFRTGSRAEVIHLCGVPTAVLICYDAEFPELVRRSALDGALLVIVPTALGPKWRVVSELVVPTRAYENGIFMAYGNYASTTGDNVFCGLSVVAGPDGRAIARAEAEPCVLEATLELGEIDNIRKQLHFLRDLDAIAL